MVLRQPQVIFLVQLQLHRELPPSFTELNQHKKMTWNVKKCKRKEDGNEMKGSQADDFIINVVFFSRTRLG